MNAVVSIKRHADIGSANATFLPQDDAKASWKNADSIDFYREPPNYELTLDEFEEYALARLKVLRTIEEMKTRNTAVDKYMIQLEKTLKEFFSSSSIQSYLPQQRNLKRIDVASHFILRAAYCRTEDLRRWFLTHECALFRFRLECLISGNGTTDKSHTELQKFLRLNQIELDQVSDKVKEEMRDKLLMIPISSWNHRKQDQSPKQQQQQHDLDEEDNTSNAAITMSIPEFIKTPYYKIPFTEALDLVMDRLCYVHRGYAYVPLPRLIHILVSRFRTLLSKSLTQASLAFTHLTGVEEASRIAPLLYNMNSHYTGRSFVNKSFQSSGDNVTFDSSNIDDYVENMPLCMAQLHRGLQRDHKLKHNGRLQYGLFLKGAGLSMEEHMLLFQKEFTKIMSPEKFIKEYGYNIRHMHGKEGKRADYTPYNCTKIIMGNNPPQGPGEHHGCPYKHYDDDHLSALLQKLRIGTQGDRETILAHKRSKNYALACIKHFEVTHPEFSSMKDLPLNGVGNHPNAWFMASMAYRSAKTATKDSKSNITQNHESKSQMSTSNGSTTLDATTVMTGDKTGNMNEVDIVMSS